MMKSSEAFETHERQQSQPSEHLNSTGNRFVDSTTVLPASLIWCGAGCTSSLTAGSKPFASKSSASSNLESFSCAACSRHLSCTPQNIGAKSCRRKKA
eukprot:613296-Amphidinium_carterae.1